MNLLTELHYLPNLAYFTALIQAETIMIEACENYQKQTYRNRCYILGANKTEILTIPVKHLAEKQSVKEVEIDYNQRWLPVHKRAIASAYGKAPFFEEFFPLFEQEYDKKYRFLFDLNMGLLTRCLYCMQVKKKIMFTDKYNILPENGYFDLRNHIIPGKEDRSVEIYKPYPYSQMFGREFVSNLSVIDLLFAEGNFAIEILSKSFNSKTER
jgi:hypothetical protein